MKKRQKKEGAEGEIKKSEQKGWRADRMEVEQAVSERGTHSTEANKQKQRNYQIMIHGHAARTR